MPTFKVKGSWEVGWTAKGAAACDLDVWVYGFSSGRWMRWMDQARWFEPGTDEPRGPVLVNLWGGDPNGVVTLEEVLVACGGRWPPAERRSKPRPWWRRFWSWILGR